MHQQLSEHLTQFSHSQRNHTARGMPRLLMKVFWWLLVRGWVPDWILRWKIRAGLQQMLDTMDTEEKDYGKRVAIEADFVRELRSVKLEADHI